MTSRMFWPGCAVFGALLLAAPGCSLATKMVANTIAAPGDTFTSDDDPELVRRAIPTLLKLQESILASVPKHAPLLLSLCSSYTGYAYAFVGTQPSELLWRMADQTWSALAPI